MADNWFIRTGRGIGNWIRETADAAPYAREAYIDNMKAFGRGMWNGANIVAQGAGGLAKGLSNVGSTVAAAPFKGFSMLTGVNTNGAQNAIRGAGNKVNQYIQKGQNTVNEWNNIVQNHEGYQYKDPNSAGVKYNYWTGTAVPVAEAAYLGATTPLGRLAMPVKANGPLAVGANVLATGLPMADYAFGLSRPEPTDNKFVATARKAVPYISSAAALSHPSAFMNALINRSNQRAEPFAEAAGSIFANSVPNVVDRKRGFVTPYVEKATEAIRNVEDINYDRVGSYMDALMNSRSMREAVERTRDELKDTPNSAYLRLPGLQPSGGNPLIDRVVRRNAGEQMYDAFTRGMDRAMLDNPEISDYFLGEDTKQKAMEMSQDLGEAQGIIRSSQDAWRNNDQDTLRYNLYTRTPRLIDKYMGRDAAWKYYNTVSDMDRYQNMGRGIGDFVWNGLDPRDQQWIRESVPAVLAAGDKVRSGLDAVARGDVNPAEVARAAKEGYMDASSIGKKYWELTDDPGRSDIRWLWGNMKDAADAWWAKHRQTMFRPPEQ